MPQQGIAGIRSETDAETPHGFLRQAARSYVFPRAVAGRSGELLLVETGGHFHDLHQRRPLLLPALHGRIRLRHGKPRLRSKLLHRLGEAQALLLDQESEDVTLGVAAEAVIEALAVIDMEGRCLLMMERTAGPPVAAPRLRAFPVPLHDAPHNLRNRDAGTDLVEK